MQRRKFLSLLSAGGIAAAVSPKLGHAASSSSFSGHPDAVGVLHDSVRCIGCRKCELGCQQVNGLPDPKDYKKPGKPFDDLSVLDNKRRTDFQKFTVVNKYETGKGRVVFRKFQCNHCQEPACASACFVKAFVKTPEGPVVYKPHLCVGCRYCMIACPFYVPTYDYDSVLNPLVYKCTMCSDTRLAKGLRPGCVDACPKDALTFGKRSELLQIARQRIVNNPGVYVDHIYGENEMGGTNWLYLSPVSHEELDQPVLNKTSAPELTSGALGAVAMVAGVWPVLLGGAYFISKRREKTAAEERQHAVTAAIAETTEKEEAKMQAALAKAAKEKDSAIAREVKNAREEAIKEMEAKMAQTTANEAGADKSPENGSGSPKEEDA